MWRTVSASHVRLTFHAFVFLYLSCDCEVSKTEHTLIANLTSSGFGEGPLQTEQQVTAPSKPRLKLVLRREGNNGDGIPATIPANASQTVGGGDPGPISSPLTSVDGDEGTRACHCAGPARRKKVKSAATSGRSNFEQLETVASSSKNASNKRCLEEVSSEMAATAGRDIPKRTRLSPKPIDTVHIAPLISPTGIELSPEDLPGQGPSEIYRRQPMNPYMKP